MSTQSALIDWQGDLSVLIGVGVVLVAYAAAWKNLRPEGSGVSRWKVASFVLGAGAVLLALYSPLHDLSDHFLFSAHMLQHLLLVMAMPILLLLGTPGWLVDPVLRIPAARRVARVLTLPPVAFFLFNLAFASSHMPAFYDLVLGEHALHTLEHLVFMGTAVLLWWPVFSPSAEVPRIPTPPQILYLFLQTFPMMMVGAMVTDARAPLYQPYTDAPRVWDISPLADQQAGGLLMWIGATAIYLLVITIIFFRWAAREERKEPGLSHAVARRPGDPASVAPARS
jgi:putative membrane protein